MNLTLEILFVASVLGLAYIFAGYPLLVWVSARMKRRRSPETSAAKDSVQPDVSIAIVAYNEANSLPRKLDSLFASTEGDRIREVLIGSDGSTDDTARVLAAYPDPRVRLIHFDSRRGKPAVLNDLVPQCLSEIVLLADARQEFDKDCIVRLLDNFADPQVGVVSGELVLRAKEGSTTAAEGIGFYWKYEKFIRLNESRFRGVPGATGACYAIRKSLFRPIPEATILDDVAIPMQAVVAGYRCLFEPQALVFDEPAQTTARETTRKRRTIAGAAQLVRLFPAWLLPWRNPLWFEYVSHKLLRLVSPLLMVTALVTNVLRWESPMFRVLLALQVAFYGAALTGWICQRLGKRSRVFGPFLMFVTLNGTTVLALWDALRAKYRVTWQKTT